MDKGGGKRDDAKALEQTAANMFDSQLREAGRGGGEHV